MRDRGAGVLLACATAFAAATALAVTGCTAGQPGPAPATSGSYQVPTNNAAAITLPNRPRSLPLTGIDPCSVLTAAQQTELGLDAGVPGHPDVHWHDPQCGFQLVDPGTLPSYNVQAVTAQGIEFWLNPMLADNITKISVAGFPGVTVTGKESAAMGCSSVVSVADGQMLIVQLDFPPQGMTVAQSCVNTNRVAAAAVATLQTAN